ncbi:MAG: class I SAM-dependent methyltransferase [Armatimonadota bacterium]|nr:MAG: class I SAM-dependent methyltransferase [Armatimonadota bacterium]
MRPAELAKMFDLEDTYWWFVARRELVRDFLARCCRAKHNPLILDVGCGTGATLKAVADLGMAVGLDRSPEALHYCQIRGLRRLSLATAEALPVASQSVDALLALDLLEHLPDDAAAAREFARVLRPGGILLVTVPACPELWSEHDEALDHLRRYRASRLRRILLTAGLRLERLSPLITALLVPITGLRLIQRILPRKRSVPRTAFIVPPRPINWLLTELLRLERRWLSRFTLPIGVSLMALARKP